MFIVNLLRIFHWRNESSALETTLETFTLIKESELLKVKLIRKLEDNHKDKKF